MPVLQTLRYCLKDNLIFFPEINQHQEVVKILAIKGQKLDATGK